MRRPDALVEFKVSAPEWRPHFVSRGELIASARGSGAPVLAVTAPAGYGKSSLLAEWAEVDPRRSGWISVDRDDDDPDSLLSLLVSSCERLVPEHPALRRTVLVEEDAGPWRAARRLAAVLSRVSDPFLLLLDDLHELRSPACHEVLAIVLGGVPPGAQVVCASRFVQPHLARLRAQGDVLDLDARDLALDADGVQRILAEGRGDVTYVQALRVTERTEGWPAGVRLAAQTREKDDAEVLDSGDLLHWTDVSGEDRHISDYLRREVYGRLDVEDQRFLRHTSVLERLHGPLCDALTGQGTGQDRLHRLESMSVFLAPLAGRRAWYRHHPLFRDFLRGELRRSEPRLAEELHLRAADWLEANGQPDAAVEHLLCTSARRRTVKLLVRAVPEARGRGQQDRVEGWFDRLDEQAISDAPVLAALAAWVAAWSGRTPDAERWAGRVEATSADEVELGDDVASFRALRSLLRAVACSHGPDQMLADAEEAAEREPSWSPWRASALHLVAEAHLLNGAPGRAKAAYHLAADCGRGTRNTEAELLSRATLAHLLMDDGDWEQGAVQAECALGLVDEHSMQSYGCSVIPFAAATRLALHRVDPAEADRQLDRAMQARRRASAALPWLAVGGRLQMVKLLRLRGDRAGVSELLAEVDDLLRRRPALGILQEHLTAARSLVTEGGSPNAGPPWVALTPAELRLLPYLTSHLRIVDVAQRLNVSRNTVATELSAIYRKLGVSSRGQAVDVATRLGLLGE